MSRENRESKNIETIKRLFQSEDLMSLNELGKFLKACWEKRAITIMVQEIVKRVEHNLRDCLFAPSENEARIILGDKRVFSSINENSFDRVFLFTCCQITDISRGILY